jgi:orotidine-5'-phosphate decarboxylase
MTNTQGLTTSIRDRIILALDVSTLAEAINIVEETREFVGSYKVGLELFSNVGREILDRLRAMEVPVFFDGKFHDIPNTVAGAVRAITSAGVFMLNVHATGGATMLRIASRECKQVASDAGIPAPKLLGVTLLTSMDDRTLASDFGWHEEAKTLVLRLALLCQRCGLDGVVASPQESALVREACGPDFLIVTPGIRPAWADSGDQLRVMTPKEAIANGSDYIVVGRPVTQAQEKQEAAKRLLAELET